MRKSGQAPTEEGADSLYSTAEGVAKRRRKREKSMERKRERVIELGFVLGKR